MIPFKELEFNRLVRTIPLAVWIDIAIKNFLHHDKRRLNCGVDGMWIQLPSSQARYKGQVHFLGHALNPEKLALIRILSISAVVA